MMRPRVAGLFDSSHGESLGSEISSGFLAVSWAVPDNTAITNQGARDWILQSSSKGEGIIASGVLTESEFPEGVQTTASLDAAQGQNILGPPHTPEHA